MLFDFDLWSWKLVQGQLYSYIDTDTLSLKLNPIWTRWNFILRTRILHRVFLDNDLEERKIFKVTEYHLPMVLFKYWFKFSLTGLRKKKIILHKIYSILTFEKGELVQCFNTSAFRCNSIVKSLPSIRFLHPPPHIPPF